MKTVETLASILSLADTLQRDEVPVTELTLTVKQYVFPDLLSDLNHHMFKSWSVSYKSDKKSLVLFHDYVKITISTVSAE